MKIKDRISKILLSEFISLNDYVNTLRKSKDIFPKNEDVLRFLYTEIPTINVIIIGQDPYHREGQANGIAFSVNKNIPLPPSLKNIYKEIEMEFSVKMSKHNGDLNVWVEQGVLLLNTTLTVEKSKPNSHVELGWNILIEKLLIEIQSNFSNIVFILWGKNAMSYRHLFDEKKHLILTSAHPSPFSAHRGFFGNQHFKEANKYLLEKRGEEINWII